MSGPKTDAGKAIVSRNALSHGVLSQAAVIPGLERAEDWEAHREAVLRSLAPAAGLEAALAERAALLLWRLQRVSRYEGEELALGQERVEEDFAGQCWVPVPPGAPSCPDDFRFEVRRLEQDAALLHRLAGRDPGSLLSGEEAAACLEAAAIAFDVDLSGGVPPGRPSPAGLRALPTCTASRVRKCMAELFAGGDLEPDRVLQDAVRIADAKLARARGALADVETRLDRMRRERLLPNERTLEKVTRYEAHLSRELARVLASLRDLRDRRPRAEETALREAPTAVIAECPVVEVRAEVEPPALPAPVPAERNCETNSPPASRPGESPAPHPALRGCDPKLRNKPPLTSLSSDSSPLPRGLPGEGSRSPRALSGTSDPFLAS